MQELKKQEAELIAQLRALDRTLLDHKIEHAAEIVGAQPLDREAFNARCGRCSRAS